jgi:hypothetical protein
MILLKTELVTEELVSLYCLKLINSTKWSNKMKTKTIGLNFIVLVCVSNYEIKKRSKFRNVFLSFKKKAGLSTCFFMYSQDFFNKHCVIKNNIPLFYNSILFYNTIIKLKNIHLNIYSPYTYFYKISRLPTFSFAAPLALHQTDQLSSNLHYRHNHHR